MKQHVLIVDAEPLVRNRISTLLEAREFTCDQAASLSEAQSLLGEHEYQMLMLDLMLPEENGFRALEVIKERFPQASKHVVVMTRADRKFVDNLPADGWCAVLLKPFSASELYHVVDICTGGDHAGVAYH